MKTNKLLSGLFLGLRISPSLQHKMSRLQEENLSQRDPVNLLRGVSLILVMAGYTVLSWILFFRDQRAIAVISSRFYPEAASFLASIRVFLVHHWLNTLPTLLFVLVILSAFYLYIRVLRAGLSAKKVILLAVILQVVVFFSYPVLSTDVLSYILSDRIAVVYHDSVWTTLPSQFKSDPYFGLADWTNQTRIYGGVNQFFYNLATPAANPDLLDNLALHKLVVFLFVLAALVATYKILARFFPKNLASGLALVFLNPMFVIETVGSGHNDILMIFFMLVSVFFFLSQGPILAGVFLALAVQVKTTALILAVFLAGSYFGKKQFLALTKFLIAFAGIVMAIYWQMGVGLLLVATRTGNSISVYWQSLPMLVHQTLPRLQLLLTVGLLLFLVIQMLRVVFAHRDPLLVFAQTLFGYLLFFLAAYWNWYMIWVLVVVPFLPVSRFRALTIATTASSLLAYAAYWVSLRFDYQHPIWPFVIYLTLLSGPLVVVIYERFVKKISL